MIIGITGRGGSGKSTVAKLIKKHNPEFFYIDVDLLVENSVLNSDILINKVNMLFKDKKYTIDDIVMSYFKKDEKNRKIHRLFIDEVERVLYDKISSLNSKNIIIDWFLLHKMTLFKDIDIKILTVLNKLERIKRVSNREKTKNIDIFIAVDNCYDENYCCKFDYIIDTMNEICMDGIYSHLSKGKRE